MQTTAQCRPPREAILEVPVAHRAIVQKIIEQPVFLRRLLIGVAEKKEESAAHVYNETRLHDKQGDWGNPISFSQDWRAAAKFYRRAAAALFLPDGKDQQPPESSDHA